jgi:hypothetical protein
VSAWAGDREGNEAVEPDVQLSVGFPSPVLTCTAQNTAIKKNISDLQSIDKLQSWDQPQKASLPITII